VIPTSDSLAGGGPACGAEQWPDPDLSYLDERRELAPRFPVDVFGPFWSEWLNDRARGANAPVDYVAAVPVHEFETLG
jgi:hypothetical protein